MGDIMWSENLDGVTSLLCGFAGIFSKFSFNLKFVILI